jgi:hypothetical protein
MPDTVSAAAHLRARNAHDPDSIARAARIEPGETFVVELGQPTATRSACSACGRAMPSAA